MVKIMEERAKKLEKLLEIVCRQYEDDCKKCPYQKECDEYAKLEIEKKG